MSETGFELKRHNCSLVLCVLLSLGILSPVKLSVHRGRFWIKLFLQRNMILKNWRKNVKLDTIYRTLLANKKNWRLRGEGKLTKDLIKIFSVFLLGFIWLLWVKYVVSERHLQMCISFFSNLSARFFNLCNKL